MVGVELMWFTVLVRKLKVRFAFLLKGTHGPLCFILADS